MSEGWPAIRIRTPCNWFFLGHAEFKLFRLDTGRQEGIDETRQRFIHKT